MNQLFCHDCKFFKKRFLVPEEYGFCTNAGVNLNSSKKGDFLVTGKPLIHAAVAREFDHLCGPKALHFQSK